MLRKRLLLERGWVWMAIVVVVGGLMTLAVALVFDGTLPDPYGQHARGYTLTGMLLGGLVVAMGALVFGYALRKRGLQESVLGGGSTMMAWLWLHVSVGVLTLLAALLHAGFGAISLPMSSGKLLLYVLIALTLSGIVWRLMYRVVPPRATKRIGNYSEEGKRAHAESVTTEIAKIAAGKSEHFQQLQQWLEAAPRRPHELEQAAAQLGEVDRTDLLEVHRLLESRRRAHGRLAQQGSYTRWLQIWRVLHVPLALAIAPLLVVHVVGAFRVTSRLMPMGKAPSQDLSGFVRAKDCRGCHRRIYDQWKDSMHAHAMTSPVMIVQTNQVIREELASADSPDPKLVCVNCHGPVGVALTNHEQATLPLERDGFQKSLLNEGISCTVCHQLVSDESKPGRAGLSSFQQGYDPVGDTYYGTLRDPVGNSYHKSGVAPLMKDPETLCVNCHNVVYDLNGDGKIEKGVDLVLQETTEEYFDYKNAGGATKCIDCHMPANKRGRVAERALLFFEQDGVAPQRVSRDHSFVAVDYPLDAVADADPHRARRRELLQRAAVIDLSVENNQLTVEITNNGTGHNLPTGFAFTRQIWLEVKLSDGGGELLFSSGVLAKNTDDLCDATTLDREPAALAKFVRGCLDGSDPQLVSFQQMLVDRVDIERDKDGNPVRNNDDELVLIAADGAEEAVLQRLKGGAVPRVRPFDKKKLAPIPPFEARSFVYPLPFRTAEVSVRLMFRSMPPYFLRALAAGQPKGEKPRLEPLIGNLQIEVMAERALKL